MSLGLALWLSAPAVASQAVPGPEIVVVGERRPRKLQDTAASVTVMSGSDIEKLPAADRLESILPLIPNVQLGTGGDAPSIRGQDTTGVLRDLPAFLGGTRPRTTLQVDGRPTDYFELVFGLSSMWDLERVEVFRSPQTITQGRNAIAGAIFVNTADPTFDWTGKARALASTSGRRQVSGAVGGPLLGKTLAFRVSADLGRDRPSSKLVDAMVGAGPDIDKQWVVRAKLLAQPDPSLRIEAGYSKSRSQMPQIEGIRAPFRERSDPVATYGIFGSWVDAVTSEIGYRPSDRLQSTTTLTFGHSRFRRYAPDRLGEARVVKRQWTAEQILRWTASETVQLLGGLHWLSEKADQHIDIRRLPPSGGIGDFDDFRSSVGLFGEVEWTPIPALTLAAALRRQSDRQERDGAVVGVTTARIDYHGKFDAWLPRVTATWRVHDRLTVGAMTQKAFNAGGATLLLTGVTDTFDAESLWDHELFARGTFGRGQARWSLNLFLQHFRDAQRPQSFEIEGPGGQPILSSALDNAPRARSRGLEAEIDWRLSRFWRVKGAVGLLDTRITRTLDPADPILGKDFQRAPRLSASTGVEWTPSEPVTVAVQVRGRSRYFSDDANKPSMRISGAAIVDGRASWDFGPARLSIYGRNLADRYQFNTYFSPSLVIAEDPREIGLEIDGRF